MVSGFKSVVSAARRPSTHLRVFYLFVAIVGLTGGGSREDILSLAILRPVAAMFLAWALFFPAEKPVTSRGPLFGLLALALLTAAQLIPLPPAVWTALPGREIFARIGGLMGLSDLWRPLTLTPGETLNALFSLLVPFAALALLGNIDRSDRSKVLIAVIVLSLVSAALGMAQLAGPSSGPLYLYRVTNFGEPVGLFANRNHEAVLLAVAIVLVGWFVGRALRHTKPRDDLRPLIMVFAIPLLMFLNLAGGSRLGFALAVLALFPAAVLASRNERLKRILAAGRTENPGRRTLMLGAGFAVVIVGLTIFVSQSEALDRFMVTDASEEMRAQLLPIFGDMISTYFPWGSGFGSFEHVYRIFEPIELIESRYLNQAHNDLAQFLIEGGLPGALLVAGAFAWFALRCIRLWRSASFSQLLSGTAMPSAIGLAMVAGASLFDYPMRTPIWMMLAVIFAFLLDQGSRPRPAATTNV